MAFRFDTDDHADMSEINMTPLVDVMLVLLVVFMVTLPVVKHAVNVALPQAQAAPIKLKTEPVRLGVDAQGAYVWNGQSVSGAELKLRLEAHAKQFAAQPDAAPVLQLYGDANVRYEAVAQVMALAQRAGVQKISVVTQLDKR